MSVVWGQQDERSRKALEYVNGYRRPVIIPRWLAFLAGIAFLAVGGFLWWLFMIGWLAL